MEYITRKFLLPDDMEEKLGIGECNESGLAIRNEDGTINSYLKMVKDDDLEDESLDCVYETRAIMDKTSKYPVLAENNWVKRGMRFIWENKEMIIATSVLAYQCVKNRYLIKENKETKELVEFKKSFIKYMEAIRTDKVTLECVNDLILSIDKIKGVSDVEREFLEISINDLDLLINYTYELAGEKSKDIMEDVRRKSNNTIIELKKYLEIQKKMMMVA